MHQPNIGGTLDMNKIDKTQRSCYFQYSALLSCNQTRQLRWLRIPRLRSGKNHHVHNVMRTHVDADVQPFCWARPKRSTMRKQ